MEEESLELLNLDVVVVVEAEEVVVTEHYEYCDD